MKEYLVVITKNECLRSNIIRWSTIESGIGLVHYWDEMKPIDTYRSSKEMPTKYDCVLRALADGWEILQIDDFSDGSHAGKRFWLQREVRNIDNYIPNQERRGQV